MFFDRASRILISALCLCGVFTTTEVAAQRRKSVDRDILKLKGRPRIHCTVVSMGQDGRIDYTVSNGKTRSVALDKCEELETLDDRLTQFFEHLDAVPSNGVQGQWALSQWAVDHELPQIARLQAYRCLFLDCRFAAAHKFLKHSKVRGRYLWRREAEGVTEREFRNPRRGRLAQPWLLSPHFRLRSSGDVAHAVGNLFDLERVWLAWKSQFRADLAVSENLEELGFDIGFVPKRSTTPRPYFDPSHEFWFAYTDFAAVGSARPRQFFELLTHQLMNSLNGPIVAGSKTPQRLSQTRLTALYDRNAVWLEIGFGWWFGSQFKGAPSFAKRVPEPRLTKFEAVDIVAWMRRTRKLKSQFHGGTKFLPNLIGWHFDDFFRESKDVDLYWLTSKAFVSFLMSDGMIPGTEIPVGTLKNKVPLKTRSALLSYIKVAFSGGKGNSSKQLDRCLGYTVEDLESLFVDWLMAISGG